MKHYFFVLVFFFSMTIVAQQKQDFKYSQTPLSQVLKEIQEKNDVSISFASDVIEDILVTVDIRQVTWIEFLSVLESETGLIFEKISDSQIIVTPNSDSNTLIPIEALDDVIILGYVTNGIDKNKDGSIAVDTERLGILPGMVNTDIAQSIQLIPGISTLDESATGIQVRGGSPDQNLILYDNIKLFNTGYFYGMFSLFNPFATQKATIYRSGTSASYGDRISGIIDISSGHKIYENTKGGLEVDGLSINGYLKTALSSKIGLYLFARRSYSDLLETPTYTSYVDKIFTNFGIARDVNGTILELETDDDFSPETSNNTFNFADVSTKLIIKPNDKNDIEFSALYTRNRLDFDFKGGDEVIVDSLITQNKGLSFNWKHNTSEKQQEELTVYFSEYNSYYQNDEIKDETGDGILDLSEVNIRENNITDIGVNFTSVTQIAASQKLTLGYQLSYTDLDVTISKEEPVESEKEVLVQDDNNLKNALFGEYTIDLNNKGLINAGVRFSHYSSLNEFLIEPRINFEYALSKRLRSKIAIERRNQPISQLIEFNHTELRLENNLWRLSDDEQYPLLSSNQISGGLLYSHKSLNIDIDFYYKELKGLTTFTNGFSNPLENLEQGESTIKGIDVLLKYKRNNYKVWLGYTFNDITFQFPNLEDTPSKFNGNNDITHQFRISNSFKLNNWQFALGWQIRTGKPITPVNSYTIEIDADGENAGVVNFGAINSDRLPSFHRLDASVLYDFKIKKTDAQLGISFLNIYNRIKPLNLIYKAERKPLDDGGIAVEGTTGATPEEREIILEQVIQRFSLGFTPNISFKLFF
ncbi:TonB-dependent receptor plug domain-containing protein [Psychroserpens luteolus]|uniref:TonB-dependent receptor plug domain-containing protein n=1 Tax=Psychroserpens luteolus TaxID=2855840 RepID=UPI001E28ABD7|nr:TonB-dependent receptor plug domain-containing protein [Psychroserpens luteolus]MCD2258392.1 TonB-dependent receptor plug domain-containing protein [Psychroserpens luteolus]